MDSWLSPNAEIRHLLDDESGEEHDASTMLACSRDDVMKLYHRLHISLRNGEQRILCGICSVPVYLVSRRDTERFFFRHIEEDGNCPSRSRGDLTEPQIRALRYHGQRESQRHIRLKNLIADSVDRDPKFTEPVVRDPGRARTTRNCDAPMCDRGSMTRSTWPSRFSCPPPSGG